MCYITYVSIGIGIIIEQSNRMDNATLCKSFKIISHEKFNEEKCYNVSRNENRFVIVNDVEYNENSNALHQHYVHRNPLNYAYCNAYCYLFSVCECEPETINVSWKHKGFAM